MSDKQPEALRLADLLAYCDSNVASRAIAELRRQHAEIEALRADAERYRWLRTQIERQRFVIAESCAWDGLKSWSGDSPDKRIDAAREAQR